MISNFIGNLISIFFLVNLLYIGKTTNTISNYDASIENYNLTSHLEVNITEINLINEGKGGKEVKIVDTYAYVLDDNGFKVFDITEPMNEILLYDYSTAGYLGHTLTISGDYAIAGSCDNGLTIFNISDSDYPTFVGSYFIGGCYGDLSSNGSILYTSSSISGFVIISIENPSSPTILGNYSGLFYSFLIENDTTFISSTDGLMILDIKDPYNITEIGFFDYEGIVSIEKQNNFLFLGVPNGLLIIDVADKTKINQISFLNTGGYIVDLKFNNSFLYYTQQGEKGFGIIDITNKTNPTKLEFVNFSGPPYDLI